MADTLIHMIATAVLYFPFQQSGATLTSPKMAKNVTVDSVCRDGTDIPQNSLGTRLAKLSVVWECVCSMPTSEMGTTTLQRNRDLRTRRKK